MGIVVYLPAVAPPEARAGEGTSGERDISVVKVWRAIRRDAFDEVAARGRDFTQGVLGIVKGFVDGMRMAVRARKKIRQLIEECCAALVARAAECVFFSRI